MVNIKEVPINQITLYDNNPRRNEKAVDVVAHSIQSFGFKVPVVLDVQNTIVCGHTRVKAAQKLGLASVPCVIADDLTEAQIKAFRVADNRTHEFAEWDIEKLQVELSELDAMDIDIEMTGFSEDELDRMIAQKEPIDLDEDTGSSRSSETKTCFCPKCGFEFEV